MSGVILPVTPQSSELPINVRESESRRFGRHAGVLLMNQRSHFVRITLLLLTVAMLVAVSAAFIACSGQNSRVAVDMALRAADGSGSRSVPLDAIGHSAWDQLLRKYVDRDGMVNYSAWKASEGDRATLKSYLASLGAGVPAVTNSREGSIAFWINAYNALTVHGILDVYPTSSIRNYTAKVVGYNIWDDLLLPVGDRKYSLNQIEHEILRKSGEPRIHFAIVCASIGCPRLLNEAYTAERLEEQLAANTRDFFARRKNFQVDRPHRRIEVSAILDWFGNDFGSTPQKALARLATYMPDEATRQLVSSEDYSVSFIEYDWGLNRQ